MAYYPRLRDLREDKDLSIRELAEKLHIQRTTYHNYETGKRELPFDLAIKIAEFYNVSLDYIANHFLTFPLTFTFSLLFANKKETPFFRSLSLLNALLFL